jgi:hypothetical protein
VLHEHLHQQLHLVLAAGGLVLKYLGEPVLALRNRPH